MPASLISLRIRGVRSYSPLEAKTQVIEFMPLTLIVGSNGSGKTTVIESLKFIISGEEPPLSDSRRNFLHSTNQNTLTKNQDGKKTQASIQLDFRSSKGEFCMAKRDISLLRSNSTPAVSSYYRIKDGPLKHVHKQDDWNKTIPFLFNIPNQALLNNVILCHQEHNLWCMGDSSSVKQVFDKIFGCEQYKKEIKHIEAEIKACKSEMDLSEKDVKNYKEAVTRKRTLENQVQDLKDNTIQLEATVVRLNKEIEAIVTKKQLLVEDMMEAEKKTRQLDILKSQLKELSEREKSTREGLVNPMIERQVMSDDDLNEKLKDHARLVEDMQKKQEFCKESQQRLLAKIDPLLSEKTKLSNELNSLKVLEWKFRETKERMEILLRDVKANYQLPELDLNNLDTIIVSLKKEEEKLLQYKSEQSQLEDDLSSKTQHLSENLSKLEIKLEGFQQKINNKEFLIKKLKDQLAESDPIAKDLVTVTENFEKMSFITDKMPKTEQLDSLVDLVEQSKSIIEKLVVKIKKEGGARINEEIKKGNLEIEETKFLIENTKSQKEEANLKRKMLHDDYVKVRIASKEAHNKVVTFSSTYQSIRIALENFRKEKQLLATKNIAQLEKQLALTVEETERLQKELNKVQTELTSYPTSLRDSYQQHEQFKMNIRLRGLIDQIEAKNCEINSLKLETKDVESKLLDAQREIKKLEREELRLRDDQSKSIGSKNELKRSIDRLQADLRNHSNSDRDYSESLGRVVCNSIIINDLNKLKECFQQSIITFHNQMIIRINEVLRLRWRQIYQGSDIDYIQLVDEEIVKGKDKKTYNYYIAMRKGELTMKMREKSSAGQKALASIILRMTLAELFVKDFAFIALDEPTANLDLANVQSLASAIGVYVKKRTKNNINIQWIIITHDESFLKALDIECSPFYYKTQLISDGCSQISRISFQEWQSSSSSAISTQSNSQSTGKISAN